MVLKEEEEPEAESGEEVEGGVDFLDVENADLEAAARASLKSGEFVIKPGFKRPGPTVPIHNTPALLQRVQDLEYKVPEGAKRVPWVDTLVIDGQIDWPKKVSVKKGVELETTFLERATEATKEAYRRFRVMKVPVSRPSDFYADMLRSDKTMYMVRQRAAEEQRRIDIVETRKKNLVARKFRKRAKAAKAEQRAAAKRDKLGAVESWQKGKGRDKPEGRERSLKEILSDQKGKERRDSAREKKKKGSRSEKPKPSKAKQKKDATYGHGGPKRLMKRNDAASLNDPDRKSVV